MSWELSCPGSNHCQTLVSSVGRKAVPVPRRSWGGEVRARSVRMSRDRLRRENVDSILSVECSRPTVVIRRPGWSSVTSSLLTIPGLCDFSVRVTRQRFRLGLLPWKRVGEPTRTAVSSGCQALCIRGLAYCATQPGGRALALPSLPSIMCLHPSQGHSLPRESPPWGRASVLPAQERRLPTRTCDVSPSRCFPPSCPLSVIALVTGTESQLCWLHV